MAVWNDGDTASASTSVTLELDIFKDGNWHVFCVNNLSETLSLNVETWQDFCSNGFSSNAITGMELEWSSDMILKYGSSSLEFVKMRYDAMTSWNNVPMRITNTFIKQQVTVPITVTDFEFTLEAESLQQVSFTMKPFSGAPTVTDMTESQIETYLNMKKGILPNATQTEIN